MAAGPIDRSTQIANAAAALARGGVVAYPTEAVFGLGCDPYDRAAVERVFALKQRPADQALILIADAFETLAPLIDAPAAAIDRALATWPGPHTWLFPRAAGVPDWVTGGRDTVALRVTAHPIAARLARAFGKPLVSTSANRHGQPPVRNAEEVRAIFGSALRPDFDAIVDGPCGGLERPTPIRDAITGEPLRL